MIVGSWGEIWLPANRRTARQVVAGKGGPDGMKNQEFTLASVWGGGGLTFSSSSVPWEPECKLHCWGGAMDGGKDKGF